MTDAEKLAREIRRVSRLQGQHEARIGPLVVVDSMLERACKAIGSGDPVALVAAGLELSVVTER